MMTTHYRYTHLCGILTVHTKYNYFTHCILWPTCTAVPINTYRQLRFSVCKQSLIMPGTEILSSRHMPISFRIQIFSFPDGTETRWFCSINSLKLYHHSQKITHNKKFKTNPVCSDENRSSSRSTLSKQTAKCQLSDAVETSWKLHETYFIWLAATEWKWFISSHELADIYGVHRENNHSYYQYLLKNIEIPIYEGHIMCARINSENFAFGLQNEVCCMTKR